MDKENKVEKELLRLRSIFANVEQNKRDFVQRQIEQLAWLNVSIADLQHDIDADGTSVPYDNGGNQRGIRTNPDIKTLLEFQKTGNTITRTLIPLVPDKIELSTKLSSFLVDNPEEIGDNDATN